MKQRSNTRGGGVIIIGRVDIKTEVISTPFIEGTLESVGVKIGGISVINVYRPPSGNKNEFMEQLANLLDSLRGGRVVLTGDFNINFLTPNNLVENICNLYNLERKLLGVTRAASGTCIDNFLSNVNGVYSITNISIADHFAIKAKIMLDEKLKLVKNTFQYRCMKENNWLFFKHGVHNIKITGNNIEEKWSGLSNSIKDIIETSFPLKTSRQKFVFHMSQGLLKSRDKKNRLLKQYRRGVIHKEIYIAYNKIYRKLIHVEKEKAFKNKLAEAGTDGKKKWKVIKEGLLLEKEKQKINEIVDNNKRITKSEEIASSFKRHFETCAIKLAENLPQGCDTSHVMPQGEEWSFNHTTEIEIIEIIKGLVTKNSCGPDLLSNRMLKVEKYAFSRLLKPLINESLDNGVFPNVLKIANIIPVFKKGERENLNNYRPIALLPVLSKVFEKVLNAQLTKVIENGFIDDNQYGFRQGHSTEDAVLKFADKVQKELSTKNHVVSVFVDVSKAFDSCDHTILLQKIKKTGLDELGIKLFKSYLLDRKQVVIVNGINGGSFVINIGVGQGTILGPTFFKIYIMDLHAHTNLFTVKFADDSTFVGTGRSKDEVEELVNAELKKIGQWFKDNRLTLHPSKSRYIVHSRDKIINITLNGTSIPRSGYGLQEESVRMLGIEIDENLDWKCHVKAISKKISKGNYLLWRHGKKMSIELKKVIYESFIRCHILYGITAWGGANKVTKKPLEKLLARIHSKIGPKKMHTLNRLQEYNLLKLEDELAIQECKLVWRWEHKKLPKGLHYILSEKSDNLRGRRFNSNREWKTSSISARLAKRAGNSIGEIILAKTKKTLVKTIKKKMNLSYTFHCRSRDCFICVPRR